MTVRPAFAAVVLAAGEGVRLRPLTDHLPKALCPVGNQPLVDHAIARVSGHGDVAVNVHHRRDQLETHLARRGVHVSVEREQALGTAGAIGRLRGWIDGRPVLITNADAWFSGSLDRLVAGWDGERVRLGVGYDPVRPDFAGAWRFVGTSLLPWAWARRMQPEPSGLYEVCWRQAEEEGTLDLVPLDGAFIDCGTPRDYWAANMMWSGGTSVVAGSATIAGSVVRSVVWPGAVVAADECLIEAVRTTDGTTIYPTKPAG